MIKGYGTLKPIPDAGFRPPTDLEYKAVFDCRMLEEQGGDVAPGLDRLARFINMLEEGGVPTGQTTLAALFHGPTAEATLRGDAYLKRFGRPNPNGELLARLDEHGVELLVCGQSVLSHGFALEEVAENMVIATTALLVLAVYQLRGYALMMY